MNAMKSDAARLGKNLKKIRIAKGLSQGDIARSLNVARSFVSDLENGKHNPTLATMAKLAKAIGVPIVELLK